MPTALKQVTFTEYDNQARPELVAQEDGAAGTILARHYTVYETNRHLRFTYWDTTNNQPFLPIEVTAFDDAGTVTDQYAVDPARTAASGGKPTGLSAGTDQSHYVRWTRPVYDAVTGEVTATHSYFDIPSSGYGTKDTNYTESLVGYDAQGRRDRSVSPGGTISRTVFDTLGRVSSQWIGTDDTPSSGSWSPSNNSGANMTKVAQFEYDGGATGGNGNQTKVIRYVIDDVEANAHTPQLGRFVSRDPVGYRSGVDLDAYVHDSPTNKLDASGLCATDQPTLPSVGNLACGFEWEHYTDYLMIQNRWAPSFGHCYSHCKIAQNCGANAQQISEVIGIYTETYQTVICLALISQVGQCLACETGICRSAGQASDFLDNQMGFELGWQNPTGDCATMCQEKLGFMLKGDPGSEEGPETARPFGPLCQ